MESNIKKGWAHHKEKGWQAQKTWSPKSMKGKALEPMKQREERKRPSPPRSEDKKRKIPVERTGPRSLEDVKGLGSSRHASQLKWDRDNSKGVPWKTRNEGQISPSQAPSNAAKNQKAWRATTREQKAGTSSNLGRRTIRGSSWENSQPGTDGFNSLEKNNKKEGRPKAESKR